MMRRTPFFTDHSHDLPDPFDPAERELPWFLPPEDAEDPDGAVTLPVPRATQASLVDAAGWRAAEAALAADLADLAFDAGRLTERVAVAGQGAVHRLALEEAASLSWWTGDRVTSDRLALWLSYRIGAAEDGGEGLIRTAWAARRLMAPRSGLRSGLADALLTSLGEEGRTDPGLIEDASAEIAALDGVSPVTQGCALFHLWRSLDERPDHLRGLEAAVLGMRLAAGKGREMPFLPLSLTGFLALTASGSLETRLAGMISGAHRAVLAALMRLERLALWRAQAEAATADLQGRTPARLIAALAAQPMLGAAQAETETGASRAAVQRNLDQLVRRGLVREVTGQGRFRVWAAKM
jgi:DNA-binding MarR family transcriptional regulator